MPKDIDRITLDEALATLAGDISASDVPIELSSFDNFVQDVFSLSYPQYHFNSWHIRKVSSFLDDILASESMMGEIVLPRYHLKSTIAGLAFSIYRMLTSFGDGLYVSFKDDLVGIHLSQMKDVIRRNPILSKFMIDMNPRSETNISYKIGNKRVRIYGSGIFAMKRGLHTDSIVSIDDILGTIENPMMLGDLQKAERIFNEEVVNIPNKGCPMVVYGTTIHYTDLLFKLKDNPQFKVLWMPAIKPDSEHEVLWGDVFDKKTLDNKKQQGGWRAFSSEFMLMPILETQAFFSREELDKCIDPKRALITRMFHKLDKGDKYVVMGVDIGKRRNPSHIAIFMSDDNDNLHLIFQQFWDQLDYAEQASRISAICENFKVDKCYIDATRSEMEDRGLPRCCVMIKVTGKGQRNQASYAADFANRVEKQTVTLVDDDRFITQILAVNIDLKALDTPQGHGDSFWSCALAMGAYEDFYAKNRHMGFSNLGNLQEVFRADKPNVRSNDPWERAKSNIPTFANDDNVCKICNKRGTLEKKENGKVHCVACFSDY